MADRPTDADLPSDTATPTWVRVFGMIIVAAVVLFLVMLVSGGDHGPGRHTGGGKDHAPASSDGGHKAPAGDHGP